MPGQKKQFVVLLAEDNPADQNLAKRAFRDNRTPCDLRIVADGEAVMDYLHQRGAYADPAEAPYPALLLLDLNMPKMDGREVLKELQKDPRLKALPVIVLTTSEQERDIVQSYEASCNSFITKPIDVQEFRQVIKEIGSYWTKLVTLPPHGA